MKTNHIFVNLFFVFLLLPYAERPSSILYNKLHWFQKAVGFGKYTLYDYKKPSRSLNGFVEVYRF